MARTDPDRLYNFDLEINGITEAHFAECSGLSTKVETDIDREAGSKAGPPRHIPGPVNYRSITLKYGVIQSRELWDWILKAARGDVERRNVSIVMPGASEGMRWNLSNAWPSEWNGAPLNDVDKGVAIESIVLAYDEINRP